MNENGADNTGSWAAGQGSVEGFITRAYKPQPIALQRRLLHSEPISRPYSNPSPAAESQTVHQTEARRSLSLSFPRLRSWQEFRIFSAGALFAAGFIVIGLYFGLNRPLSQAEGSNLKQPEVVQKVTTADNKVVEVSSGVSVDDVDHRPAPAIAANMPKRLIIPSLRVNAPVRSLGLTKSGSLAVPNFLNQVGWYDQSARPGEAGTVVLDGHYDGVEYTVFKDLHKIAIGQEIKIERGDGQVIRYAVESKQSFNKNEVPMDKLVEGDGQERLHIITCDGQWQSKEETFNNRLIVFAKRI